MTLQQLITNATQLNTILPENQVIWIRDRLKELEDQLKVTAPTDDEKTCLVQIYRSYGEVCAQNKEASLTMECQERVRKLAPNDNEIAIYPYARALGENYEYEQEISDLTKAHALDPNDNVTTTYLAIAYSLSGSSSLFKQDYARAISDLTKAHDLTPNDSEIITLLVCGYCQSCESKKEGKDYAGAVSDATKAHELAPNDNMITAILEEVVELLGGAND